MNKSEDTLGYMLFILGIVLILIGTILLTYSTVVFVNTTYNTGFGSYTIPVATQIHPYQLIGIIPMLAGATCIGIVLYKVQRKTKTAQNNGLLPPPPPP
jgi:hypothetical protein